MLFKIFSRIWVAGGLIGSAYQGVQVMIIKNSDTLEPFWGVLWLVTWGCIWFLTWSITPKKWWQD